MSYLRLRCQALAPQSTSCESKYTAPHLPDVIQRKQSRGWPPRQAKAPCHPTADRSHPGPPVATPKPGPPDSTQAQARETGHDTAAGRAARSSMCRPFVHDLQAEDMRRQTHGRRRIYPCGPWMPCSGGALGGSKIPVIMPRLLRQIMKFPRSYGFHFGSGVESLPRKRRAMATFWAPRRAIDSR